MLMLKCSSFLGGNEETLHMWKYQDGKAAPPSTCAVPWFHGNDPLTNPTSPPSMYIPALGPAPL